MNETGIMDAAGGAGDAALGMRLSQARQAQNLATADVARRLKLSVSQVEALESGRYHQLPGPIFVRGFIRNYARLVKLDPDELLLAAGNSLPQPAARPEMPPSRDIPFPTSGKRRWPKYAIAAAVIVGLLSVYEFFWNEPETVAIEPAVVAKSPPAKPVRKPVREATARQPDSPAPAPTPVSTPPVSTPPVSTPPVSTPIAREPSAAPVVDAPQVQRVSNPEEREIRLVFDEDSWVEIRDRYDNPIFAQLNAAGTARRVSGMPPLSVVVGNAHGVRMTYGGQTIDLTRHIKIDVARFTLE